MNDENLKRLLSSMSMDLQVLAEDNEVMKQEIADYFDRKAAELGL